MSEETPKTSDPIVTSTNLRTGRVTSSTKDPAYWQALGEFIEGFAGAETMLFNYMISCAKVSHDSGRALLSGIHADQMINLVRRIWKVKPPDADVAKNLSGVFEQFKIISDRRNSIVHYVSVMTSDKGRISSNITRALTNQHIREHLYREK